MYTVCKCSVKHLVSFTANFTVYCGLIYHIRQNCTLETDRASSTYVNALMAAQTLDPKVRLWLRLIVVGKRKAQHRNYPIDSETVFRQCQAVVGLRNFKKLLYSQKWPQAVGSLTGVKHFEPKPGSLQPFASTLSLKDSSYYLAQQAVSWNVC